jgi:cytochrome c553
MRRGRGSAALAVSIGVLAGALAAIAGGQSSAPATGASPGTAAAAPAAPAAEAPAALQPGDRHRGKERSYTCLGCHGIDDYKNAYPTYSVPKLEGQNPEYIAAALHGYRDGDRSHLTMHSEASTLTDQDILDIAVYFAGKPLTASGKPSGAMPKAAALCTSCHGQDGVAVVPVYPSLAGQHEDYLVRALEEYQKGGRKNPVMTTFAANLTDEDKDMIARYFSSLTPGLLTEPRAYSRFSAQ